MGAGCDSLRLDAVEAAAVPRGWYERRGHVQAGRVQAALAVGERHLAEAPGPLR